SCCCGRARSRRRRRRGGTALIAGAVEGFGSALATVLEVKAPSGSLPSDFFTSLKTLVSLITGSPRSGLNVFRIAMDNRNLNLRHSAPTARQVPPPKLVYTLPPFRDGRVTWMLLSRARTSAVSCLIRRYVHKRGRACRRRSLRHRPPRDNVRAD